MVSARGLARLGMLAVGLGIGAAVASTPGVASADDFQISIDGFDLFPTAGNTATAVSGMGDIAIAFGAGSDATAEGGFGDYALADSTGSGGAGAIAGDPTAGATGNNFDFASATGNGTVADAGNTGGTPDTTGSSFDYASASGGQGIFGSSDAFAGGNGSGDFASTAGQNVFSSAGVSGDATAPANFDSASAIGNNTTPTIPVEAVAGGGVLALGGSNDTAFVDDPSGTLGSTADAGFGFNSDLAAVFGDGFNATATGADNLFDILGLS
jgi:hypothetical protein